MAIEIVNMDILEWARQYNGPKFHALFCDPPYHHTSIQKRFGGQYSAKAQYGRDGAFQRASRGFMGKEWDGGDIAYRASTWRALGRHMHPGAFGMAFASARGYHRMVTAIEQAGFIVYPMIMAWVFLSGFPKATRIDTQIDRNAGVERHVIGLIPQNGAKFKMVQQQMDNGGFNDPSRAAYELTAPVTPLAQAFEGYRYGGQVLKPALEPIAVFQRPYEGRAVDCIAATGAGAINIDGGRIATNEEWRGGPRGGADSSVFTTGTLNTQASDSHPLGRWPSNLILSHHPSCNGTCVPDCPVLQMDLQTSNRKAGGSRSGNEPSEKTKTVYGECGGASRMFFCADWMAERIEAMNPTFYAPKASTRERNAGLDGRNPHPTVKPLALGEYLSKLLLPPDYYGDERRVLNPFAGSFSDAIACDRAGWPNVTAIEREPEYCDVGRQRIVFWTGYGDVGKPQSQSVQQSSIFDLGEAV